MQTPIYHGPILPDKQYGISLTHDNLPGHRLYFFTEVLFPLLKVLCSCHSNAVTCTTCVTLTSYIFCAVTHCASWWRWSQTVLHQNWRLPNLWQDYVCLRCTADLARSTRYRQVQKTGVPQNASLVSVLQQFWALSEESSISRRMFCPTQFPSRNAVFGSDFHTNANFPKQGNLHR